MADPAALIGLAPTGAAGVVLVAIAGIVREWRAGRQSDVKYWRERAADLETARDHAEGEVRALHIEAERREAGMQERIDILRREKYQLGEFIAANGLTAIKTDGSGVTRPAQYDAPRQLRPWRPEPRPEEDQ